MTSRSTEVNSTILGNATFNQGMRESILNRFKRIYYLSRSDIWALFLEHEGYGSVSDVSDSIGERYDADTLAQIARGVEDEARRKAPKLYKNPSGYALPPEGSEALLCIPEQDFMSAVECGLGEIMSYDDEQAKDMADWLNARFESKGIPWRCDDKNQISWQGDPTTHEVVIEPALSALKLPDLEGAPKDEFEQALKHLRAGERKDFEHAVTESAKSVESVMKVMIETAELPVSGNEAAHALFCILRDGNLLPPYAEYAILSASQIRNKSGGHGAGAKIRNVSHETAALAVSSAAAAITYLASKL